MVFVFSFWVICKLLKRYILNKPLKPYFPYSENRHRSATFTIIWNYLGSTWALTWVITLSTTAGNHSQNRSYCVDATCWHRSLQSFSLWNVFWVVFPFFKSRIWGWMLYPVQIVRLFKTTDRHTVVVLSLHHVLKLPLLNIMLKSTDMKKQFCFSLFVIGNILYLETNWRILGGLWCLP